jgi:hypothetical protein
VVTEYLVGRLVTELRGQPVRITLVQCGSLPFRNCLVSRVSDQDVAEAEGVITGNGRPIGPDQLLAHEREQVSADLVSVRFGQELGHRASVEEPAFDRASLDDGPLFLGEPVDSG